ncbi:M20 family metallo-hydrolase [Desulfonauticus submarinus]
MDKIINSYRKEVIFLQKELVKRVALGPENGGQGEYEKANFLADYLKKLGLEPTFYNAPDNRVEIGSRPNLVVRYKGKKTTTLWIISHLDVVPEGDLALWKSNPYKLKVEDDLIYGRGVEDNQQAIVSSLLSLKALIDQKIVPDLSLGLIFVSDEETGSNYGLKFLVDNHSHLFAKDDLYLVPDHGSPQGVEIEISEKSMFWLKIEVLGKQCHASMPQLGINSLIAASEFIIELSNLGDIFNLKDTLFSPPVSTFNPTKKEANVENINTIPGRDVFYLDARVLPQYDLEDIFEHIKSIGLKIEKKYGVTIKYKVVMKEQAAPPTSEDSQIVTKLKHAIKAVLKKEAEVMGIGGGTVAAILRRKGYPTAVWSSLMGFAHQPNECSSINNTLNDAKVMFNLLFD